jgi:hypothetical protein
MHHKFIRSTFWYICYLAIYEGTYIMSLLCGICSAITFAKTEVLYLQWDIKANELYKSQRTYLENMYTPNISMHFLL